MQLQIQHGRITRSNLLSHRKYKEKKEATKEKDKRKKILHLWNVENWIISKNNFLLDVNFLQYFLQNLSTTFQNLISIYVLSIWRGRLQTTQTKNILFRRNSFFVIMKMPKISHFTRFWDLFCDLVFLGISVKTYFSHLDKTSNFLE